MARLSRQIEHWNARLAQIAKELPEVEEIRRQLPGFGPLLAAVVVGELGELSRLATPRPAATRAWCRRDAEPAGIHGTGRSASRKCPPAVGARPGRAASLRVKEAGSAVAAWIRTHQRHLGSKKKGLIAGARSRRVHLAALPSRQGLDIRRPFGRYQPAA
ncbi:MAG: hypothetical protein R3F05_02935 [Planctomycetota bacterium]